MEIPICSICKEPIWSFICTDCLKNDIKKWLPSHLSEKFEEFNAMLSFHFRNRMDEVSLPCILCKQQKDVVICPFCYISEACEFLSEVDEKAAKQLLSMIPFPKHTREENVITESERERFDEGICECCGEYSELLKKVEGRWLCERCEENPIYLPIRG